MPQQQPPTQSQPRQQGAEIESTALAVIDPSTVRDWLVGDCSTVELLNVALVNAMSSRSSYPDGSLANEQFDQAVQSIYDAIMHFNTGVLISEGRHTITDAERTLSSADTSMGGK